MCVNREQEFYIVLAFNKSRGNIIWPYAANEMRDYIQDLKTIKSENGRVNMIG